METHANLARLYPLLILHIDYQTFSIGGKPLMQLLVYIPYSTPEVKIRQLYKLET
jgi:hypothetical protein